MAIKVLLGHSQGVEDSYLRLSVNDLAAEWRKAEQNLRLDVRSAVDEAIARQLARSQLITLKLIENQLLHLLIIGESERRETGSTRIKLDEVKRHLEQVQRQIQELEKLLPRSEVLKINRRADDMDVDWGVGSEDDDELEARFAD